ncbi:MAG: hypothetical protein AB2992_07245 (plasmid) [Candidatus Symbiodolus clandestinus]
MKEILEKLEKHPKFNFSNLAKEYNQILNKLVLVINPPSSIKLNNVIESEMKQFYKIDPHDYNIYNKFQRFLLNWLVSHNRERNISNQNWENFFAENSSKSTDQLSML